MPSALFKKYEEFANQFIGKKCWNVRAGAIGSTLFLDLGGEFSFDTEESPPPHGKEPIIIGEYVIEVRCAAWRLDDHHRNCVLATSDDDNREGGPMLEGLRKLVGATLNGISLREPGWDCSIMFDNSLSLEIFPFSIEYGNYGLWHRYTAFEVGGRSTLAADLDQHPHSS
jgi:hypothetical protein